ncbi:MAG: M42 family metallopeptidase [Clostridia bacterium]|jgi:endoglucanase|nr:M42 family metallopeptidase [Clostridia bacterium]
MQSLEMIKEMTLAHGTSGFESDIKHRIKKYLQGKAEFSQDNLGSLICKKQGAQAAPRIMIPGHMDEIGFMVNSITKNGFIKFIPLGGWWDQVLLAQKVIIKTSRGDREGIIGSTPPHLLSEKERKEIVEKKNMYIDVGAKDKEEAQDVLGICPGDPIVPSATFHVLNQTKNIMAKALDNRLGCCLFIDILSALQTMAHPNTVYGVGTVQEEVGLRGAATAANLIGPDICIVSDVTVATDTPGLEKEDAEVKLGAGPVLTLADASLIGSRGLRDLVIATAKENNIPLQLNAMMGGGTDGGAVHKVGPGVPTIVISFPTRYIHSHYSVFNYDDYDHTVKLMLQLIMKLDQNTAQRIKLCE